MRLAQEVNAFGNEVWDRGQHRMKVSERMKGEEKRGKRKCHSVRLIKQREETSVLYLYSLLSLIEGKKRTEFKKTKTRQTEIQGQGEKKKHS